MTQIGGDAAAAVLAKTLVEEDDQIAATINERNVGIAITIEPIERPVPEPVPYPEPPDPFPVPEPVPPLEPIPEPIPAPVPEPIPV